MGSPSAGLAARYCHGGGYPSGRWTSASARADGAGQAPRARERGRRASVAASSAAEPLTAAGTGRR
jgi:hypothetical protein